MSMKIHDRLIRIENMTDDDGDGVQVLVVRINKIWKNNSMTSLHAAIEERLVALSTISCNQERAIQAFHCKLD
jgi:hypothetical protein